MNTKQTDALKLALEALKQIDEAMPFPVAKLAQKVICEALAQQETVLPGGGHVPAVPVAVYGYCPECGGAGVMRERRPNGDDKCTNGHKYPSSKALAEQPAQQQEPVAYSYTSRVTGAQGFSHHPMPRFIDSDSWDIKPLYTSPQPRQWQGLTEEEIGVAFRKAFPVGGVVFTTEAVNFYRAIEAKLKEKNA